MKKFFLSLAVFVMALCANAQTNQYFWYQGNLMMGNPIAQIDSVTFGEGEPADTLHILLPRTIIKTVEVHDTTYIIVHDTVCPNNAPSYLGHQYVDLGLPSGLLWATCNVGAEQQEQIGEYISWGELHSKASYHSSDYQYAENPISLGDISGTPYDAARTNWGGEWRMPTRSECMELAEYCTRNDTVINGAGGIVLRGTNNNYIFVPYSGEKDSDWNENQIFGIDDFPSFWTSTACGSTTAYRVWEWSYVSMSPRFQGFPIRPVVSKNAVEPVQ